ncbi:Acetyltransferase (GNAT) family protein [Colwellia chukchiensis]|uniref:Acetyltransferase (GNAT) family protein n=1 Tax=Colwellia chukchiensis TaxID=641665 RepID=A0A1H7LUI0_9GAMM|nr:GNAT family N-acetyltransferase [Colwellia chukchiensis]SEL02616.1 Acetyltransferase (GNAT) family protein [Colwellia chukchiensis]
MNFESTRYSVTKASKIDKKDILRFYKGQNYRARFIGQDDCYFIKHNNKIIACSMISAGKEKQQFWLLHALVTDIGFRNCGLARTLLHTIQSPTIRPNYPYIVCFADNQLHKFYLANNFRYCDPLTDIPRLPVPLQAKYYSYCKQQPQLNCYLYSATNN